MSNPTKDKVEPQNGNLSDFPKIYCPFIRQTFKVNRDDWKKYGSKLQLTASGRCPEARHLFTVNIEQRQAQEHIYCIDPG